MRFVGALETLLDPIVAMLDALPEHFDPDYAPRDILNLLERAGWASTSTSRRRSRCSATRSGGPPSSARRRGTKGGLELALSLAFPGVPLRVEDDGGIVWSADGQRVESKPSQFVVYCDKPVNERCPSRHRTLH